MISNTRPAEICKNTRIHLRGTLDGSVIDRNLDCINIMHWHSYRFIYFHNEQPTCNIFIKSYLSYDTTAFIFLSFILVQDVGLNLYGNLITMVGKATIIGHMNISRQTSKQNW